MWPSGLPEACFTCLQVYPIFGQDFDPRIKVGWQWRHVGGTARRFGDDINFFNGSVVHGMRYNSTDGVAGPSHMPIKGFKGVENWTQAGAAGAIVHIFHPSFWGNWFFELESFDPENSTLMLGPGGFQEAHGEYCLLAPLSYRPVALRSGK
eukprot:SAG11_NODE_326_length_10708_cov_6.937035_10_plen_151_part_00